MSHLLHIVTVAVTLVIITQQTTLKILNTPNNPPPGADSQPSAVCREATICSGVSLHSDPTHPIYSWWDSSFYRGRVGKRVDMSGCGFISSAVITTTSRTLNGVDTASCPGLFTSHVTVSSFNVYSVEELSAEQIGEIMCDVHWIATGYSACSEE